MSTQAESAPALSRLGRAFTHFMASGSGRVARVILGFTLAAVGVLVVGPPAGYGLLALAIVPVGAGVFNLCPMAPLWGGHFSGAAYCARKD